MLTGKDLLDFVRSNADLPKDQLMDKAGYTATRESDGKKSYKSNDFMNALLEAQGIVLTPAKTGGIGRQLSYKTSCMKNGNVTIGKAYFEKAGASKGDAYEVIVGEKQIILKPAK